MKGHIKKHFWILEISPYLIVAREKQQPSGNSKEFKGRSKERRSLYKADKKHDQLRSKAIKEHEDLARSARFEQIWKKRGSIDAEECSLHEKYHLYNVIRVDAEDEKIAKSKGAPEVDGAIFDKYLPLLKEFLPQAAEEIEHDKAIKEDKFVYDIYTVGVGVDTDTDNTECKFMWRMTIMMVHLNLILIMKATTQMLRTIHGMIIVMKCRRKMKMKMRMKVLSLIWKIPTLIMIKKLAAKRKIERTGDGNIVKFVCHPRVKSK